MNLELAGKTVLVSGASRGIGRAIALSFAREGARVAICARGAEALAEAKADLDQAGPGPHLAITGDVTTAAGADAIFAAVTAALGGLDILVNNVGGSGARTWDTADEADFE